MKPSSYGRRRPALRAVLVMLMGLFVIGFAAPAMANVAHYDVRVDGLACPFCAYGLEKKLKKLPGVSRVDIDLESGRASFDVASDTLLMPGPVREAVREAGFTPRAITVRASGTVQGDGNDLHLDVGDGQRLQLRGGDALGQLRELVGDGHRSVIVTGAVTRSGDTWRLRVDQVQRRGS